MKLITKLTNLFNSANNNPALGAERILLKLDQKKMFGKPTLLVREFSAIQLNDQGYKTSSQIKDKNDYGKVITIKGQTIVEISNLEQEIQVDRILELLGDCTFTNGGVVYSDGLNKYTRDGSMLFRDMKGDPQNQVDIARHILKGVHVHSTIPSTTMSNVFDEDYILESFANTAYSNMLSVTSVTNGGVAPTTGWCGSHPLIGYIHRASVSAMGTLEIEFKRSLPTVMDSLNRIHADLVEIEMNYGQEFVDEDLSMITDCDSFNELQKLAIKRYMRL